MEDAKEVNYSYSEYSRTQETFSQNLFCYFWLPTIDALVFFSPYLISEGNPAINNFIFKEFHMTFNSILSYFILKIKLFKHHFSGIILTLIGFLIANLFEIIHVTDLFHYYSLIYEIILACGFWLFFT